MNAPIKTPAEYVIERIAATYGAEWERAKGAAPSADVKTVWEDALSSFTHSNDAKRAILWALENLPERCPNAIQFRNLCRQAPAIERKRIEAPKADPERVAEAMAKLGAVTSVAAPKPDRLGWARAIIERRAGGEKISPTVVQMAQLAIGGV